MKKNNKDTQNNFNNGVIKLVSLVIIITLLATGSGYSQGIASARSVALGYAYTSLAKGVDAGRYNPANLGIKSFQEDCLELIGFGANISNNAFTLGEYNKYSGAFLTENDKTDILSKVPKEGLKLNLDAEASTLAFSKGSIVFAVSGIGQADINLNKDIIDLVLNGNTFADTIDINGSYSEAVGFVSASLSYGKSIYKFGSRQLAIGGSFKYLYGLGVERVIELEGMAATFSTGFSGEGKLVAQTASGGAGFAVDIGATLKIDENYTAGIRIKNFLSSISWNKNTEEHGYNFSFDTMTADNMGADYIVSDDYTKSIGSFKTNLPSVMNIGFANTSGKFLWAVDWEQGFRSTTGASTKPRLSIGFEWLKVTAIPIRMGLSTGGKHSTAFSMGSGFHSPIFFLDYAVVTGKSLSGYSTKGLNFAITAGLHF